MRYVLDASVALKWVMPEVDSPIAVRLRDEFLNGMHELFAPDIYPVEVAHALTKAERRRQIIQGGSRDQGAGHLGDSAEPVCLLATPSKSPPHLLGGSDRRV
jgi:hypothetical protein